MRRWILTAVFGVVLVAGTWFLCTNSHIDIFPCDMRTMNPSTHRLEEKSGSCSLMYVFGEREVRDETYELTGGGWAVTVLVVGIVPLVAAFLLGSLFKEKKKPGGAPAA